MTVIRHTSVVLTTILVFLALTSCTNKSTVESSAKRHATVLMQDGTKVTGTVEASSPSEITLVGDDNITRTIPMDQVRSIAYSDEAGAQPKALAKRGTGAASSAGRSEPAPVPNQPDQSTRRTRTYELPAGTEISVRSDETIDSSTAAEGQSFAAEIPKDVLDGSGAVAIPRGSNAQLVIVSASKGGRIRGASDLTLTLGSVTVGGQRYEVDSGNLQQSGKSGVGANKRTAEYTGGGAGLGAIIGAIAGGGKGAAIGAGAGAGAGALTQILTKGKAIRVPAESVLTFKLDKALRIVAVE
jgi:outer membrane lipoprotein SlyB